VATYDQNPSSGDEAQARLGGYFGEVLLLGQGTNRRLPEKAHS
jgi:hypothetical protein